MRISISGVGGLPLVVSRIRTLEDNDLVNIRGLCRTLRLPGLHSLTGQSVWGLNGLSGPTLKSNKNEN